MQKSGDTILRCTGCGAKNRVPAAQAAARARCGKCGGRLEAPATGPAAYTLRCSACGTRNRVSADRVDQGATCGKCGQALKTDALFLPQPLVVTDRDFEDKVLKSPLPVLLFCWASWCPTCGAVAPIVDEFARDARGRVRVCKLNVDANPAVSSRLNVLSVPFLFVYDNGHLRDSQPGGLTKHELMVKMAAYL